MRFLAHLTCRALPALPAPVSPRYSHTTVVSSQEHDVDACTNRLASLRNPARWPNSGRFAMPVKVGVCHDGRKVLMSNGSATLTMRDADTIAILGEIEATLDGQPLGGLNRHR